jgi:hypothetical protein
MKTHIIMLAAIILGWSNIASAKNPVELISKSSAPLSDSVQVTIDLGKVQCPALGCEYLTVYIKSQSNRQVIYGPTLWSGWSTLTIPWKPVLISNPTEICAYWHFQGTSCTPSEQDLPCCVTYYGSGTYPITCNPCDQ